MDEVSTKAKLVDTAPSDPGLTLTVPRSEVEEALEAGDGESELLLDVVRSTNGQMEQRRVALAWDRADLERLAREASGERVTLAIDPESLRRAFDADVEAHGVREMAVALSIVVATAGASVAGAKGAVDQHGASAATPDAYAAIENVRADAPSADAAAAIEGVRAERKAPAAAPDSHAAIENVRVAATTDQDSAIENVRAGREAPSASDSYTAVENVRAGGSAVPDAYAAVENVRAERGAPESGGEGITISAPSPAEAAGLAGAAALTIAGAAFALRRRRQPGIA